MLLPSEGVVIHQQHEQPCCFAEVSTLELPLVYLTLTMPVGFPATKWCLGDGRW